MLSVENVNRIFSECLFKEEECNGNEVPENAVVVSGIRLKVGFNHKRIEENKKEIRSMIENLDEKFKDGWSFLNLCLNKEGELWTGQHSTMDELMCLGLATGTLEYITEDRNEWVMYHGGMPYVRVKI